MGIYLRCIKCKSDHKLGTKICPKCGFNFSSKKKYKVAVKTEDGKRIVRHVDSMDLAKRIENSLKGKVAERKILGVQKAPTLDQAWEQYILWAKKYKKSWRDDKYRWVKHVAPILENKKMDAVVSSDIQKILNDMHETGGRHDTGCAPATVKQVLVLIKRVYNWSQDQGIYTGPNPAEKIKSPRIKNLMTECLDKDQLNRLINVLQIWPNKLAALVIKFALYSGFRQSEIFGLKHEDVNLEVGFATLFDPKGKPTTLPLSSKAIETIKEAMKISASKDCPYIFQNNKGQKRVSFNKIWSNIRNAAQLPKEFRFHGLRHTYASYLASSGRVDLFTLQKLLNHQSPQMTQRYAHLLDEALRRGAKVVDDIF